MNPSNVSAQFATYVWFQGRDAGKPAAEDAALRFARENWTAFLPCAHERLGRLLIRLARVRGRSAGPRRPHQGRGRDLTLAGAAG
jgi:hypothetical protein